MKKRRFLMALAAITIVLGMVLCGCGTAQKSSPRSSTPAPISKSQAASAPASAPAQPDESEDESAPASASVGGSTVRERLEKLRNEQGGSSSKSSSSSGNNTDNNKTAGMNSAEAIAAIAGVKADVEKIGNEANCDVFIEDEHNPYDVVWDYGREYRKFVEAVDDAGVWDVLFNAKFYKEHYPMLALQYHDDEDLLLEHFQTVGIHEGRQGSDAFNVAAYMENCGSELVKAFGEHYECYYFYWALNQDSEAGIDTQSDGHPIQMIVKMTALQARELKKVNEYREEVGADPVVVHPEFLAFANYRAWCDFTGNYTAHEWFNANRNTIERVVRGFGATKLGENTVYGGSDPAGPGTHLYYSNYRNSPDHYKTMVSTDYSWFASSNIYWGPTSVPVDERYYRYCEYDLYLNAMESYQVGTR